MLLNAAVCAFAEAAAKALYPVPRCAFPPLLTSALVCGAPYTVFLGFLYQSGTQLPHFNHAGVERDEGANHPGVS